MTWQTLFEWITKPFLTLQGTEISIVTVVQFFLVLFFVIVFAHIVRITLKRRVLPRTRLDATMRDGVARWAGYAVLVCGFMIGISTLGFNLTSLSVLAGALGVGIGFGLQNIVANFISGLIILGERPIQIGHRVEVGDAVGQVTRIGARSTSILTNDNITMIIPNTEFISARVINWSHGGDRRVRFHIPVGTSYGSDPLAVRRILLEAAAANDNVLADPPPQVRFLEFGDSALQFELTAWTESMAERPRAFRSELYFDIWERLKEAGVEVPFPQRDLHVRAPLDVRLLAGSMPA